MSKSIVATPTRKRLASQDDLSDSNVTNVCRQSSSKRTNRKSGKDDLVVVSPSTAVLASSIDNDSGAPLKSIVQTAPCSRLTSDFFNQPCSDLARHLLGKKLVRIGADLHQSRLVGQIVETEAYIGLEDKAAHSFGGRRTARNEAMFMTAGTAYVYNIYGIYTCINISSEEDGAAVLLRALEPIEGLDTMQAARAVNGKSQQLKAHHLCNGPSKLTMAFGITKANGDQVDLMTSNSLWLEDGPDVPDNDIVACSRIGIAKYAEEWTDKPLRFYMRGNPCVSIRNKAAEGIL